MDFQNHLQQKDAWKFSSQGVPFSIDNYINPDDKLLSYFGRINYDFQSKYLISATFRADGSSKFASGNQWGISFSSRCMAYFFRAFHGRYSILVDDLKTSFQLWYCRKQQYSLRTDELKLRIICNIMDKRFQQLLGSI